MQAKIVPVTQLKPKILSVISRAQKLGQEYVVTKNGHPAAVIMGFEEWESWRETIEILSDENAMKRIRRALKYFDHGGRGKPLEEVFGEKY
ncbi:MAG: type II toxin-antitoxin system Phd/YefM family antitoxin [Candidatus Omnitrophica bacterium]|nr:type II toxin-antitoxin system Phd/YefM family antitoxin [Candidatus Omnitrophota bacterium]